MHPSQTPQVSPVETKPAIYHPSGSSSAPSVSNPPSVGGGYGHYPGSGMEFTPQPGVIMPYPSVMHSDLDMRYSRSLLAELGYPQITPGMEPPQEWFAQAMGPSMSAGLL